MAPGGVVNGQAIAWFGAASDTTYTPGTDQPLAVATFDCLPVAGSTNAFPFVLAPRQPIFCLTADFVLRLTTSANLTLDVVVYGFEF